MADALKTVTGPMGHEIAVPQIEDLDWGVLEFLDGPGSLGKDWKHPEYKFGVLNKFNADTGRKLRSKYYSVITEEDYNSFKRDYNIELFPVDDPAFDAEGRLHYRELVWFKMTHRTAQSIEKANLRKALGFQPQSQAQAESWQREMLARSRGKFSARDLHVESNSKDNIETLVNPSMSETENLISNDVEKLNPEAPEPAFNL